MNIFTYVYNITKYYIKNIMWKNYFTHKSSSGYILLSIDYINSSSISEEDHVTLKNSIDFYGDDTNIGKSVINNCVNILKKFINYDKSIIIYITNNNKSIYFIINDIIYQYYIKTYENGALSGRLYRINTYNNEKLDYLYIKHDDRNKILYDINYIKQIITY